MKPIFTILTAIFLFNSSFAQNVLYYHPKAGALALGKSFDLFDPSTPYASDIFKSYQTIQTGRTTQDVYLSVISSKYDYRNTLHIDASIDASFLSLFSANASYTKDEAQIYNENSLTICLQGISDFGNYSISQPVLNDGVKELTSQPEKFKQAYGEFFVSSVHKQQILYLFITLNNISQTVKQQISADLGGGGGVAGIFSADAQYKMNSLMEQFKNTKSFTLRVKSFGKNALTDLPITEITDDFFRSGDFSGTTYNSIIRYMNSHFNPENSSVTEYFFSPLSQFGYRNDDYFNKVVRKYQKYISLCEEFNHYNALEKEIKYITSLRTYSIHTPSDEKFIKENKSNVTKRIDDLSDALSKCRQSDCNTVSSCCNMPDIAKEVDVDKLHYLQITYLSPLEDFNFFQLSSPTILNFYPNSVVDIFSKYSDKFLKFNIKEDNTTNYVIQSNLAFVNNMKGHSKFIITLWINNYPMGSTALEGDYNSIIPYNFASEPMQINNI